MTDEQLLEVYNELAARIAAARRKGGAKRLPGTTKADILLAAADPDVRTMGDLAKALNCSAGTLFNRLALDDGDLHREVKSRLKSNREHAHG